MNLIDIVLIGLIAAVIVFAVRLAVKRKKKGCCDGNCGGCPGCR